MALVVRPHTYVSGNVANPTQNNENENTLYTLVNGNLDKDNLANSLGLDPAGDVDGSSEDEAAQKATANPGTSTSQVFATNLEIEIQQIRHILERINLGNDAVRYDGSAATTVMWGDLPVRRLVYADSFEGYFDTSGTPDVPEGWTNVTTETPTITNPATQVSEGAGNEIKVVGSAAGAGAEARQGIQRTFAGLKASTLHLITVRARVDAGDTAQVITTGGLGSGDFQNLAATHLTTTSTTYVTLAGVVSTDATPTDLVVQLVGTANTDVCYWDDFCIWECGAAFTDKPAIVMDTAQDTSQTYTGAADDWTPDRGTTDHPSVTIPGPGYVLEVQAFFTPSTSGAVNDTLTMTLQQDVDGGGYSTVATGKTVTLITSINIGSTIHLHYALTNPVPGSTYTYKLAGSTAATPTPVSVNTTDARITVKATRVA